MNLDSYKYLEAHYLIFFFFLPKKKFVNILFTFNRWAKRSIIQKTNYEVDITYRYLPHEEHRIPLSYPKSNPTVKLSLHTRKYLIKSIMFTITLQQKSSSVIIADFLFIIPDKSGQINCEKRRWSQAKTTQSITSWLK